MNEVLQMDKETTWSYFNSMHADEFFSHERLTTSGVDVKSAMVISNAVKDELLGRDDHERTLESFLQRYPTEREFAVRLNWIQDKRAAYMAKLVRSAGLPLEAK